jgi:hypothetical protein
MGGLERAKKNNAGRNTNIAWRVSGFPQFLVERREMEIHQFVALALGSVDTQSSSPVLSEARISRRFQG